MNFKLVKNYFIIFISSILFSIYLFEVYITQKVNLERDELQRKILFREKINSKQQELISLYDKYGDLLLKKKIELYKTQTNKEFDLRDEFGVYEELKNDIENLSLPNYPISFLGKKNDLRPLSGLSHSVTMNCNENGYVSFFHTDRYGFNNPDDEWDKEKIEYLIVGDSFAMGSCVNRPNDIASVLRKLSNKPVLNLGYGGNGPLLEYISLKEYLDTNVNKVLWFFYEGNDFDNLDSELTDPILVKYLNDKSFTQNLRENQNKVDDLVLSKIGGKKKKLKTIENENIEEKIELSKPDYETKMEKYEDLIENNKEKNAKEKLFSKEIKDKQDEINKLLELKKSIKIEREKISLRLKKFITFYNTRNKLSEIFYPVKSESDFEKIMKLAKEITLKNNSQLYLVFIPAYSRYVSLNIPDSIKDYKVYSNVKEITNKLDIPFIDIHEDLINKENNKFKYWPFGLPGHFNVYGYKKISELVFKNTKNLP